MVDLDHIKRQALVYQQGHSNVLYRIATDAEDENVLSVGEMQAAYDNGGQLTPEQEVRVKNWVQSQGVNI
ncbi:MAG TPA: hypothetical protein V6C85_34445 [Allocoleopsis sp.]